MALLFSSQTKSIKPNGWKLTKASHGADHKQRPRKMGVVEKLSPGSPSSSKLCSPRSHSLESKPGFKYAQEEASSPSQSSVAGQRILPTFNAAATLEELLKTPIQFVKASQRTTDTEMARARVRKPLKNLSDEHVRRRRVTGAISKKWPTAAKLQRLGLQNPGNYCYRRSFMQNLIHAPIIVNWLASVASAHAKSPARYHTANNSRCRACSFNAVLEHIWHRKGQLSPLVQLFDRSVNSIRPAQRWMLNGIQADSHEFATVLIDDFATHANLPPLATEGLFKLRILSERTCSECRTIHTANPVDETGLQLSLSNHTVEECVRDYFTPETVKDSSCEGCHSKKVKSVIRKSIDAVPEVLVVQLKRFTFLGGNKVKKNSKRVAYDEFLDLTPYAQIPSLRKRQDVLRYKLQAVVAHEGDMRSGHYIAYARGPQGWARFSDSSVSACKEGDWLKTINGFTPYILTYVAWDGHVAGENNKHDAEERRK